MDPREDRDGVCIWSGLRPPCLRDGRLKVRRADEEHHILHRVEQRRHGQLQPLHRVVTQVHAQGGDHGSHAAALVGVEQLRRARGGRGSGWSGVERVERVREVRGRVWRLTVLTPSLTSSWNMTAARLE